MFKKTLSCLLAILCIMSTSVVGISATDSSIATGTIYFKSPEIWENESKIYCHIINLDESYSLANYQSRKELCTEIEDGLWAYDLSVTGNFSTNDTHSVFFITGDGSETIQLVMTADCIGDTAYCDGTTYITPGNKIRPFVFWENQDPVECGPLMFIAPNGEVYGTCLPDLSDPNKMFSEFLYDNLIYAQKNSGKSDQQLIDDIITALGISENTAIDIIEESGVSLDWGKGYGDYAEPDPKWQYEIVNNEVVLKGFSMELEVVNIPETIEGMPVTGIDSESFFMHAFWKDYIINIPASVTDISVPLFYDHSSVVAINVHEDNPVYCSTDGVLFNKDKTELIAYPPEKPDKVATVDEGVKTLCENSFLGADMKEIILPDSLETIADGVFHKCSYLEKLNIPDSVSHIDGSAFKICYSLTDIDVDPDNQHYCSVDDVLFNKDKTALLFYPFAKKTNTSYTVPEGVTEIGIHAFQTVSLKSLTLPDSLERIEYRAFHGCEIENKISIPENVNFIGEDAFSASSVATANLPNVTEIPYRSFFNCDIENITLGEKLTYIGEEAFMSNKALESIIIPDAVTTIDNAAFQYCYSLADVTIPYTVTTIGESAFADCAEDMVIRGYSGSVAEAYAIQNGINFINIDNRIVFTDDATGITVIAEAVDELQVVTHTDTDTTDKISSMLKNETLEAVYEIALINNREELDPSDTITIKIPVSDINTKIYIIEGEVLKEINATYVNGYIVFNTENPETYILTKPSFSLGDVNMDGTVNVKDATAIQKHLASIITLDDTALSVADYDGDEKITVRDATAIQKFVAGLI